MPAAAAISVMGRNLVLRAISRSVVKPGSLRVLRVYLSAE
jgi:hypothetical protein